MTLRAIGKVNSLPLMILTIIIILISLFVIPFFIHPLLATPLYVSSMFVYGTGFFLLIPFYRINKTTQGSIFGLGLVGLSVFVGSTGIFFTYNQDLRQVILIVIPILFSILSIYYVHKYSKKWNAKSDQTSSYSSSPV